MSEKFCYRGAKEICNAVGENWKEIVRLIKEENLPAFRRRENGTWKALPEDLEKWIKEQRDKYLVNKE